MSLFAHLEPERGKPERRSSRRRSIRLNSESEASPECRVVIHNLSKEGMLLESAAALVVGETIDLIIAEAGSAKATILWNSGRYFGCRFGKPLTGAAVSAAQLKSSPPPSEEQRKRAIHNAMSEIQSLAKVVEQITEQVERAIDEVAGLVSHSACLGDLHHGVEHLSAHHALAFRR